MPDRSPGPMASRPDQRTADRFETALAVDLEGWPARTRNISANGVYFETDIDLPLGSLLNLHVQFTLGGRERWLACEGKVVRVTPLAGHHGVAARLLTPFFSSVQEHHVTAAAAR